MSGAPPSDGFAPDWLAARDRYDVAALDPVAVALVRAWAAARPADRPLVVADLGAGTGAGLGRALGWLGERPVAAYAVDRDPALLAKLGASAAGGDAVRIIPVRSDVLGRLDPAGGPADGSVDLIVAHAVADLLPLDRLAARIAALARPGGIAHIALTYDGETAFDPPAAGDAEVVAAYHRHMDRRRAAEPSHGGSTAGRRLGAALEAAGLVVRRAAPSVWDVRASDGPAGRAVLRGLIDFVVHALAEQGDPPPAAVARWERDRRAALAAGRLRARVRHLDVLAEQP